MTAPTPAGQPTAAERETGEELQARLAEALDEHRMVAGSRRGVACGCGWGGRGADHQAHVASALAELWQAAIDQARADELDAAADAYDEGDGASLACAFFRARATAIRKNASERTTR